MNDPFSQYWLARVMATGLPPDVDPPNLSPSCRTEDQLNGVISDYYLLFCEGLAGDRSFLLQIRPDASLKNLRQLLYDLRTAKSHSDNHQAKEAAYRWRAQYSSSQDAADALATRLVEGLKVLAAIALDVSRQTRVSEQWRRILEVDTATVFSAVESDLQLSFSEGNRRRMVRLVEKRLEVQPRSGERRQLVADYCAQQILSQRRPLPVSYDRVLDSLGLIGSPRASGALLVAYSVTDLAPSLRGSEFLSRVEETWRAAVA